MRQVYDFLRIFTNPKNSEIAISCFQANCPIV